MEKVNALVSENAVVIFSKSSCTMSHSVKALFADYGTNPKVYELDEMAEGGGGEIEEALSRMGCKPTVPTVFIHGELVGGAKEVISLHIQGSLVTKLQDVGALST